MKNTALKAALAAMGVRYCEENLSEIADILDEKFGITIYNLDVATPKTEDVIKEITKEANQNKSVLEKPFEKKPKNKWIVPKTIGKPQKRKG